MKTCASILEDYVSYSPENITDTYEKKRKADQEASGAKDGKRPKKEKKIKDPNEPKRPPSAYLAYQNAVREDLKKAQPDIPYAALMGQIAEKWKSMTAEEKQVRQEKSTRWSWLEYEAYLYVEDDLRSLIKIDTINCRASGSRTRPPTPPVKPLPP